MMADVECASNAKPVHQQYDGVKPHAVQFLTKKVGAAGVPHAAQSACARRERRNVDRAHLDISVLQRQRVAASSGPHVKHMAAAQIECHSFKRRHLQFGTKQSSHGNLVIVKHRRQHPQRVGMSGRGIVPNGLPHGVEGGG